MAHQGSTQTPVQQLVITAFDVLIKASQPLEDRPVIETEAQQWIEGPHPTLLIQQGEITVRLDPVSLHVRDPQRGDDLLVGVCHHARPCNAARAFGKEALPIEADQIEVAAGDEEVVGHALIGHGVDLLTQRRPGGEDNEAYVVPLLKGSLSHGHDEEIVVEVCAIPLDRLTKLLARPVVHDGHGERSPSLAFARHPTVMDTVLTGHGPTTPCLRDGRSSSYARFPRARRHRRSNDRLPWRSRLR